MKTAGFFLLLSAALHLAGVVLAGFNAEALFLIVPAAVYVLLFAGLSRGMMWVAWFAFIAAVVGAAGAISELYNPTLVPDWVLMGILGSNLIAAVLLFGAIWAGPKTAERT